MKWASICQGAGPPLLCLLSVPGEVVVASICQESRESAANNTQTHQPGK